MILVILLVALIIIFALIQHVFGLYKERSINDSILESAVDDTHRLIEKFVEKYNIPDEHIEKFVEELQKEKEFVENK